MLWLAPHPPLPLLSTRDCAVWSPSNEDYAGQNDRHVLMRRDVAHIVLGRYDARIDGRLLEIAPEIA